MTRFSVCVMGSALTVLTVLAGAACGAGGADHDAPPPGDAPPLATLAGEIEVVEIANPTRGSVWAHISATAIPMLQEQTLVDGACRMFEFEPGFCGPNCFDICAPPDVCVPYPTYESVGTLTLGGLKTDVPLQFEPTLGWYLPSGDAPTELFDAGDVVSANATGDVLPGFSLSARGVAPLVAPVADPLTLRNGTDTTLSWTAGPDATARVRLVLRSPNRAHGLPLTVTIVCDGPDSGEMVVPRAMVETLPPMEAAAICAGVDCPRSELMRYTRDTQPTAAGDIVFTVGSRFVFAVNHVAP